MVELIALYIVCKNIGVIARTRGVNPKPFQVRAIVLWIVFEGICIFAALAMGLQGILLYIVGFGGALLSLFFSFRSVRSASPKNKIAGNRSYTDPM